MASPSGNLLAGRYRTLKRLGSGGMAIVLLCEDQRLGRQVAVKRMHAESPEEVAKRFRREAQLGASLNHPNIVSVFDIETDDENVLIVMEYVPGGTLKDALARGPLPRDAAFKLLRGVASAIDYAHEHDVVHRDVKPANILLDADGRAKLADLGIATAAEVTSITSTGAVLGTASYMPPERLDGDPGGVPADIYALATVAYETLTGRKARQGRSAVEVAAMVMSDPPPDLRTHLPDAPEEAAAVLARGMARDPAERPATAGELIDELCRAFDAAEPEPEPEPQPEPTAAAIVDPGTAAGGPDHTPRAVPQPTYRRHRAEGRRAAAPVPAGRERGRADRRWLLPVAALIAALIAVGVILALAGGDDSPEQAGNGDVRGATTSGSDGDGSDGGGSDSGGGQADPGGGGSAPGGGAAGGGGGSAEGGSAGGADTAPAKAVQDFYTLAANDDFEAAWELAGPGVREQLGGYDRFVATLDSLEKIEFPKLQTTLQSADRATVDLQSVATHTDRTDRCSGNAELSGGGDTWKIERLNVDCNQGTSGGSAPPQVTPGKGPAGGKPKKQKKEE